MKWRLEYSRRALRDLGSLDRTTARRVLQALERLAGAGYGNLRRLQGSGSDGRLRVGDWRVRLTFDPALHTIRILRIRHRREAYRE